MTIKGKKRTVATVTGLLFGVAALWVFLFRLRGNWGELYESARMFRYELLIPAMLFIVLMYVLRIVRWHMLLQPFAPVTGGSVTVALFIGFFANNVLPARAGEIVRPYVLSRRGEVGFGSALASVVIDRVLDMVGIMFLMLATGILLYLPSEDGRDFFRRAQLNHVWAVVALTGLLLALGALVILLVFPGKCRSLAMRVAAILPERLRAPICGFSDSVVKSAVSMKNLRSGAVLPSLSAGVWFCQAISTYFIAMGLGLEVGLGEAFLATLAVCFAIALPQAPGYLGTYHLVAAVAVGIAGVAEGPAGAFAIVLWGVNILPVTFLGLVLLIREGIGRSELEGTVPENGLEG